MVRKQKRLGKGKEQFRSVYCGVCKQRKSCQLLEWEYCCSCAYQREVEKTREYSSLEKVLAEKQAEQQTRIQQLKLLWEYSGCSKCSSKEVDAYDLLEYKKLVCQPCLIEKTSGASGALSWEKQNQWYKKRWGINVGEWLDKYNCLPINANCAKKWLKDKEHLSNCACLEEKAKETYELFANSLREKQEKLKDCQCKTSEKVRISSDYYVWCESCEETIAVASKKRVIKNRNDPRFWGLNAKEKVLCGDCLEAKKKDMKPLRRAEFNRYRKVGRL